MASYMRPESIKGMLNMNLIWTPKFELYKPHMIKSSNVQVKL